MHYENSMPCDEILYDVADFYKVFGDSTRIKILYALLEREISVGELTEELNMTQSAVSHQLRILRQNDLVKFRKDGKTAYYSLDDDHISVVLQQGLNHILHKKDYGILEKPYENQGCQTCQTTDKSNT